MKIKIYLTAVFALITFSAISQDSIPNQYFERWDSSGKPAPFDWMEPSGWTSTNGLTEFVGAGVTQTQYPGSGSTQAKLRTLNIFGSAVPSVLINGDFTLNISDTSKLPLLGGTPYTMVEQKLYGLYNFVATDSTDSASITVMFKKWNSTTQQTEAVAGGNIHLGSTEPGLHPFILDIQQIQMLTPDSVVITISSSNENGFKHGGELIVDFVSFDKPMSAKAIENNLSVAVYPNPANDYIFISAEDIFSYIITDVSGKTVMTGESNAAGTSVAISQLTSGLYFIQVNGNNGNGTGIARFVKQ